MEEDHYSKEFDDAPMPHSIFFTKIGHAIHGTDSVNRLGSPASHGCVRLSRANAATLYALVGEQGVLNTTVTLTGSSQVALARNPRPRTGNTAVARRAPQYEQQYDNAGDPVVITPEGQRMAPQARADDGYIYPSDGSSASMARRSIRGSNITMAMAATISRRRRAAIISSHGRTTSSAGCSRIRTDLSRSPLRDEVEKDYCSPSRSRRQTAPRMLE